MVELTKTKDARPDLNALLAPLKDFQRRAVDHAFKQLFLDGGSGRFLVADEVGLGKTLIARGVIAHAIERMWDTVGRIDVVYVCSNAAIANANIAKLAVGEHEMLPATRLTLLPQQLRAMRERRLEAGKDEEPKVLFSSFSPGTALNTEGTGRADERLVLYSLMAAKYGAYAWVANLLQVGVSYDNWKRHIESAPELDQSMIDKFGARIEADEVLRGKIEEARTAYARFHDYSSGTRSLGSGVVGRLRRTLAEACIDELEPDLVILDEFQRFKTLLVDEADNGEEDEDVTELARQLFHYKAPEGHDVKLLLLSATPYRMLTTDWESEEEDHYGDFISTTNFLMKDPDRLRSFEDHLAGYRKALHKLATQPQAADDSEITRHRDAVQRELRSVMSRSERVRSTRDRESMVLERSSPVPIEPNDLAHFQLADAIAKQVEHHAPVEYWKSAPYLPNFMPDYVLKRRLVDKLASQEITAILRQGRKQLVRRAKVRAYQPLDTGNPRLRAIIGELLDGDRAHMLWVPPTLPYWLLGGAFCDAETFTKALVFSAWKVVPDAVSVLMSYEAECRTAELDDVKYDALHKKRRGLLTFGSESEDRQASISLLAFLLPSLTLVEEVRPALWWQQGEDVLAKARARVGELVRRLPEGPEEGPEDKAWYWAAPIVLDRERQEMDDFLGDWHLTSDQRKPDPASFTRARNRARDVLRGKETLGRKPMDLVDVLTDLALGAPGTVAARTMLAFEVDETTALQAGATIAEGFRSLFNQPTAMGVVRRRHGTELPYWHAAIRYCQHGCLQALLDEQAHLEWEQASWREGSRADRAMRVAASIADAASIKTSNIGVDTFSLSRQGAKLNATFRMRTEFALRYGSIMSDDGATLARADAVRTAFNSPFHPFVLVTTSVGQEGLDFHPWCHAIYHWNLPGNPVDLEQREGRVHRYKGHALRRNVAALHSEALRHGSVGRGDIWQQLFEEARRVAEASGKSEMVPYWVHEGPFKVERRVPLLPFSRERELFLRLKRSLALYRVVFGQPRQQELLDLLERSDLSAEQLERWVLDLSAR